jgi:outer membrane protein OmpA-like peptidoglycan-associated protein
MFVRTLLALTVILGGGAIVPALAQTQTPNADQIVKSLTPTDNLGSATRGIRIGNAPGHAAGTPSTAKPASISLNVEFASGSASLTPEATRALDQLGQALGNPTLVSYHFRIEGHTDTVGDAEQNKSLSERRAEAVVSYLTSKYQIDPSRLKAIGMGENGLLVATPDQTPEARNRRVLVINAGS